MHACMSGSILKLISTYIYICVCVIFGRHMYNDCANMHKCIEGEESTIGPLGSECLACVELGILSGSKLASFGV